MFNWWKNYRMKKRVRRFLAMVRTRRNHDNDLWDDKTNAAVEEFLINGREVVKNGSPDEIKAFANSMQTEAERIIPQKPQWFRTIYEFLDFAVVVMVVIFGFRALFFQPFKIPTGSMQPTLFGIHYVERDTPYFGASEKLPAVLNELLFSATRAYLKLNEGGYYVADSATSTPSPYPLWSLSHWGDFSRFMIGENSYTLPGSPRKVAEYAKLMPQLYYPPNHIVADGYLSTGDHLFVERVSHLFNGLKRGDIVVFNTEGLYTPMGQNLAESSGFYYVKRLVGLPGDTLKLVDGMLYVKPENEQEFRKITDFSPEFDKIFSGLGGYHGYTYGRPPQMQYLMNEYDTFTVPEDHYFMLGDNSAGSLDSRSLGTVPRSNIVGKAMFVFWPFSRRWGIPDSKPPIPEESGSIFPYGFVPMKMQ